MRKLLRSSLLCVVLLLPLLLSCACSAKPRALTFTVDAMSITLTDSFFEQPMLGQTVYYESDDALVTVLKEHSADMDMTVSDYAESVIRLNKLNTVNAAIETEGDLVYFSFEQEVLGKECCFTAFVYKSNDAFWLVQFVCDAEDATEKEPVFLEYARSVTFVS